MNHKKTLFVMATIGLVALGCTPRGEVNDTTTINNVEMRRVQMRVYQAPPGMEEEIRRILREITYPVSVITEGGMNTQFVYVKTTFTTGGLFVVSAPLEIHQGIESLLGQLKGAKPRPPTRTVETNYWLVLGWPAASDSVDPALGEVAPALSAISALGHRRFVLLEKLQLQSQEDRHSKTTGRHAAIGQTASLAGDRINLDLKIKVAGLNTELEPKLETTLNLKPGQLAVLGETGFVPKTKDLQDQGTATLFYIARARVVE